jgi:UDP-N-acetylmuramate: L-alanyl-gamma-D-glutamyl-meso-diaminopimelate ligase
MVVSISGVRRAPAGRDPPATLYWRDAIFATGGPGVLPAPVPLRAHGSRAIDTPTSPLDIYLVAIGGTGMAPLACLLQELGHRVRGSDKALYPPMSDLLAEQGIEPLVGFDPGHLDPEPDLVVVGNAVPRSNPEVEEVERRGLPRISMPQALHRFCLRGRRPLVVAGTHGKTTTTSMAAWTWADCGLAPGYLIGGRPRDLPRSFALGSGPRFCVEGDEYNAAYFDRGPKFLHYRADTLVLTSVEYDHADLYPDPEVFVAAFERLVRGLGADGLLVACGDEPEVRALAAVAPCRVILYGLAPERDVHPAGDPAAERVVVRGPEGWTAELAMQVPGVHNLVNALGVWAAACADGIAPQRAAAALSRFRGVARRLEELGTAGGVTVVDDFAHHPTAVAASLRALRQRHGGRRLVALYEPRSLTAGRSFLHDAYREAFAVADVVGLPPVFYRDRLDDGDRLDLGRLAADLQARGVEVFLEFDVDALATAARSRLRAGDVVVTMSSGSFEGLPRRLLESLTEP